MTSKLDPFVKHLFLQQGDQLRFEPNEPVVFIKAGKATKLSKNIITERQILSLISEVAPPELADELGQPTETEFRYDASAGAVQVRVIPGDAGRMAVVSPANDAGPRAVRTQPDAGRLIPLLEALVKTESSDLHLRVGDSPIFRTHGEITWQQGDPLAADELESMLRSILPGRNLTQWEETGDTDFGYELPGTARFRVNAARDRKGPVAVFRAIPAKILTVDDLGVTEPVRRLCFLTKGLVLVTGPTGSGKSTTLCALTDLINRERKDHLITIEDPIEFVHENKSCLVTQREVGTHTASFKAALRAALREDPDVVVVGEMRDLETTAIAIETAETGHLVFATLHTTTAASTVDRIIDQFPADRQSQIRTMLSESLKGVISQTLCKRARGGRVAAWEILLVTPAVSNLIREGKTFQIPSILQTGKKLGMTTLNDSLLALVDKNVITAKEAYLRSVEKVGITSALRAKGHNVDLAGLGE